MKQAKQNTEQLEESLSNYLTGYGSGRPENLQQIIAYGDWRQRARNEVERRIGELAERLDTETLIEIAEGRIDITDVAQRVLDAQ